MKRLLHMLPLLLIASCEPTSNTNQESIIVDSSESKTKSILKSINTLQTPVKSPELDSLKSLEIFKAFALNYSPTREPNSGVAALPEPSDSVLESIEILKTSNPKEFEKYLILLFAKLYSAHLKCCNQSYEIRRQPQGELDRENDPLIYEFVDLTGKFANKKRIEFIPSHIVYEYVTSHKYLLDFEPIKKQIEIIEQVQKNIEDGVYWN